MAVSIVGIGFVGPIVPVGKMCAWVLASVASEISATFSIVFSAVVIVGS